MRHELGCNCVNLPRIVRYCLAVRVGRVLEARRPATFVGGWNQNGIWFTKRPIGPKRQFRHIVRVRIVDISGRLVLVFLVFRLR